MASKKAKLEEGRQKVRMKLKEIDEQYNEILLQLQELVTKSHDAAIALLQEQSKVNFFKKFVRVNQSLEECSSKLFTIRLSISSETDSESDEIGEDSATSLESFNINCKAGQLPAIQNSDINVRSNMRTQHVTKMNQNNPEVANLRTSSIEAESLWISSQRHSIQSVVNETVTTESQGKIVIDLKCTEQYHRGIQPQTLKTPVKNQNIIVSGIEEIFDDSPTSDTQNLEYREDISPMSLRITDISDINTKQDSHIVTYSPLSSPSDKSYSLNELSPSVNIVEDNLFVEENHPNVFSQPETVAAVLSSSSESKIIEDESVSSTAFSIITRSSASDCKFTEENIPSLPKSSFLFNGCIVNETSPEDCKTPIKNTKRNKDVVTNQTKSSPLSPKVSPSSYESSENEASSEMLNTARKNTKRKLNNTSIQPIKTSHPTLSKEICSNNVTNKNENLAKTCKISVINNKPNQDDDDDSNQSPKEDPICNENLSKVMCNASVKNNKQSQDEVLTKPMPLSPKKFKSLNGCNENEKTLNLCEMPFKNTKPNHVSLTQSIKISPSPNEIPCNTSIENERLSPVCEASDKNKPNECDSSAQRIKISPKKSPVFKTFNEKEISEEFKAVINTELSSDASRQSVKIPLHPSNKKANLVNESKPLPTKEAPPDLPHQQLHSSSKLNKKAIVNNCDTNLMEKPSVQESMVAFPNVSEKMLDMIAIEWEDPSDFWVHLPNAQLEPLVNSMRIHYTRGEENINISKPCVGLICSALFTLDNCWYRAQILEILQAPSKGNISDCQVKVLYIDYGNSEVLPVSKLMVLKKEFMTLPRHAIHCSLARICPIGKPKWKSEDFKFVAEIINNQPLQGTCKRIKNSDNFEIELYKMDEDGTSKNISDFLVEQQCAQYYVKETSIPFSNKPNQFPASDSDGRNPATKLSPTKCPNASKGSKKYIDNPLKLETSASPQKCTCNADKASNIFHCRVHDWPDNPEANLKLDKSSNKIANTIKMKEKSEDSLNSYPTLDSLAKLRIVDYIVFTMSYISSPGEFYIHLIDSKSDSIKDLLNDFYDRHELDPKYFLTHVPPIGTICCTKFTVDDLWYRASITQFEPGLKEKIKMDKELAEMSVTICFIDYGNSETKLLSEIRLLDEMFFEFPIQTICCSLAGIEPLSDESPPKSEWSSAATKEFMSMTDFESGFIGIVHKEESCQSEQNSTNLKLFVIDKRQQKKIIINDALVRLGLAKMNLSKAKKMSPQGNWCNLEDASSCQKYLTPILSEIMSTLDVNTKESDGNSFSDWDPMAEDFESIENTYTATSNNYPRAFNQNSTNNMNVCLPEVKTNIPEVGNWVAVQVSAISENLKFSVLFPYGVECLKENKTDAKKVDYTKTEKLSDLICAMTSHYSKIKQMDKDPFLPSLGEIVAARYNDYNSWYRAKVTEVDFNTDDLKVIFLDYGNYEWINQKFVRKILPQFLQLPIQGVSCYLNNVEIKDGCKKQAREHFESLVENKILVAHVLLKDVEDVIHVDLYDTSNGNDININQQLKEIGLAHSKSAVYVGKDDSLIPG